MRTIVLAVLLLLVSLPSARVIAAEPASQPSVSREEVIITAPVYLDDTLLFSVRGVAAFPPEERARRICERIEKIASEPGIRTSAVTAVETEYSTDLTADGKFIMSVFNSDAALERVSRQVLAQVYIHNIRKGIDKYRVGRLPENIIRGVLYALVATIVFVLALILFRILYRKLHAVVESRFKARIHALRIKSFEIVHAEKVWATLVNGLRITRVVLILLLSYFYLYTVLGFFPWTRLLAANLLQYVVTPLKQIGGAFLGHVPNIIFITVVVLITRYVLKLVRLFFLGIEAGTVELPGFDSIWARPTYKIVRLLLIVFVAVIIYPYIPGSQSEAFKGISIFLGVVFSLGSTSAIANIIAGYMLTYRRAFKVGDRVKIGDIVGDVSEIRIQVTHVRTIKNEEITVPNSVILGSSVINYSSLAKEKGLILHTTVTIGYDVPWRQVDAMLLMAAEQTQGILREPEPFVHHKSLDDFFITYELNVYTDNPHGMARIYSDLHQRILDAFNEYGVQITSPHYENDPEGGVKIVPKDKWHSAPAKPPE